MLDDVLAIGSEEPESVELRLKLEMGPVTVGACVDVVSATFTIEIVDVPFTQKYDTDLDPSVSITEEVIKSSWHLR